MRTDLVTVPVFVSGAHGRRVANLTKDDFRVSDGGRPATISYFATGAARVALLFALDASGSARSTIARQRETALALLSRFGRDSRASVITFTEQATLALPFTRDAARVRAAFGIAVQPNRHTAIFDAALAAVRSFDAAKSDPAERRIVVLLSDGLDNASAARPTTVVDEAQARGVSFYVVHFPLYAPAGDRLAPRRPSRGFRELAERTGGAYFMIGDAAHSLDPRYDYDLTPVFNAIAEDLQSQYVLGFYADDASRARGAHQLGVSLTPGQNSKLRVHALRDTYTLKQ